MTAAVKFIRQAPILCAGDLPRSIDDRSQKVGFRTVGAEGEPVDFAIMLSQAPADHAIVPHRRIKDGLWNAYFRINDARALRDELAERGATIDHDLCEQPYGILEFGIQDPDQHDIAFGQDSTAGRAG